MFEKILIANRGEIALRIIKTCKAMGIKTVAVYSEADASALHVQLADESVNIGGITPRESYLLAEKILGAAKQTGAQAIHPGYGFLSENAQFASAVNAAGIVFIGPSPEAITALGDKTAAREIAIAADVPVAPGSSSAVATLAEARILADEIGFPLLIKAAAGGGGKGMRLVESAEELESGFDGAQGEALTSFGDNRVFVEKYIVNPRHIEIQIIADNYGNILYFPERECSVQRRHQKVVEESPSAAVSVDLRNSMGNAAARLVSAGKYTNAGTLEFLLDESGKFYFLEVNTRLQVEHPVTEMVSGVDLVEWQIKIAAGETLTILQDNIRPNGHAIECRICAEDVYNDFLPETGIVHYVQEPEGEGVRNDSALFPGYEVTVNYDSMTAKLICWGKNRTEAIARTAKALDEYSIAGLSTTIPFCRFVMDDETFISGNYSTSFVKNRWNGAVPVDVQNTVAVAAVKSMLATNYRRLPIVES